MVARLQYLRFSLFEMYVHVVFVIRCLYSAVSLTLVKEQRFIRMMMMMMLMMTVHVEVWIWMATFRHATPTGIWNFRIYVEFHCLVSSL